MVVKNADVADTDTKEVRDKMLKRIDRLMKAVHNEVGEPNLRTETIIRLLSVRELYGDSE